jgi:hypothetical protein
LVSSEFGETFRIFIGNLSETKQNWIFKYDIMDLSIEE